MANSQSLLSGVADRYASALFDLANESGSLEAVEKDLDGFEQLLNSSDDLKRLVTSPVFRSDDQVRAIEALLAKAGMDGLVGNFLKLTAKNSRLFAVPGMISAFRHKLATHRGEVAAEVTAASKLSDAQLEELKAALKKVTGKDVAVTLTEDPSIIGGLIVKVGSRMVDTSLKTKLNSLKLSLKEAG